ncbi:MAG: sensor histidine kinase [Geodermatophilaceae bacterium]
MTRGVVARVLLIAVCVAYGGVGLVAIANRGQLVTTYADVSGQAALAFVAAGLGLIAAGCLAATDRATGSLWALCILAGAAWLSPALVGWESGPAVVRSTGMVLAPFLLPLLVHLLLAAPSGRLRGPPERGAAAAAYGLAVTASVALVVTRDPFLDLYCWSNCTDNTFLLASDPQLARQIGLAWLVAVVLIGVLTLPAAAWRLVVATSATRTQAWTTVLPAALAATTEAGYAVALLRDPAESPTRQPFEAIFGVRAATLFALAVGGALLVGQRRRRRTAFVRLVNDLQAAPEIGSLQTSLSRSFGDTSLTVAYWLSREGRYVGAAGQAVRPRPDQERGTTSITRGGKEVAVISHEAAAFDERGLRRLIGPAALLAIDNERLGVELLAHLEELQASRRRIVTAADEGRRQIERNLHDGAQQRLLAVLFELRLARNDCADDAERSANLDTMIEAAQRSLVELRELAQGIFPAILDESGLGPALWTLADQAERSVAIESVPEVRMAAAVERTAYLVVTETLARTDPDAGRLRVKLGRRDASLVVELHGAAVEPTEYLTDRVGAAGGVVWHEGDAMRAEIPCE